MKLNCIAVDDEPLALQQMNDFISKVDFLNLTGSFKNGLSALNFMKTNSVDLLFLDIQMDDLTGIQLLESLKIKPKVILTTAYDQYALKGYELDVSDYLLKPISFERFVKAANKVYDQLCEQPSKLQTTQIQETSKQQSDYIFIKADYRLQKINLSEVLYIESMKDYLKIYVNDNRIVTHMSMKKMEEILPLNRFIRVHKSYLISIDKITSICKNNIYINDITIPVGDYYKKEFFDFLEKNGIV
jgi:two-component system, LytTR family, response regulator